MLARMKFFCLSALLLLALVNGEVRAADRELLTQYSTIPALLAGLYDGEWSCAEVLARGDLGLGTFDQLDGEMIVLGGLQKELNGKSRSSMQILGEIPFLSFLFGSNSRTKTRDEIIFFIQPHILHNTSEADKAARAQVKDSPVAPLMEKRLRQTVVLPADPLVK